MYPSLPITRDDQNETRSQHLIAETAQRVNGDEVEQVQAVGHREPDAKVGVVDQFGALHQVDDADRNQADGEHGQDQRQQQHHLFLFGLGARRHGQDARPLSHVDRRGGRGRHTTALLDDVQEAHDGLHVEHHQQKAWHEHSQHLDTRKLY